LEKILGKSNIMGFSHNDLFNEYYQTSLLNKLCYKIFPKYIESRISNKLYRFCILHQPDVLLIFKGMEILPNILKKIKNSGVYLVNYNLDHPFIFFSKGSGNNNVLESIEVYNLYLTYSTIIKNEMNLKFPNLTTIVLPFGYIERPENILPKFDEFEEVNKVCFVGNPDKNRLKVIKQIVDNNIEVHVYGHNWERYFSENIPFIKIFKPVYSIDYYKTIQKYRVQLNIFRPHNINSHNMRSFEVPAVGGILLAPQTPEHLSFFEAENEVFYYTSTDILYEQINKILNLTKANAFQIRLNAQTRSIKSHYSYRERASQLLEILNNNYE
jgi:hypothetical protein